MKENVNKALDTVDAVYADVAEIANDIYKTALGDIDELVNYAYYNVEKLSNDAIRDLILKLSLRSYSFSEIKEKSALKAALSETIRKETYSKNFNSTDGSVAARDNSAVVNTSAEILAEDIYESVSNMFKTKIDELHRVVDALKTVLMSRLTEAKLVNISGD